MVDEQKRTDGPRGTVSAEVVQVIRVLVRVGRGTEGNPNRIETQYWSTDGKYLATEPLEL